MALGEPKSPQRSLEPRGAGDPVSEMNAWLLESLRMLDGLLKTIQTELRQNARPADIILVLKPVLKRILPFSAIALYTVRREDMGFELQDTDPPDSAAFVESQVAAFIEEGTFGWAIYQNHPVFVTAAGGGKTLLFHSLATRSSVIGMFVGVLDELNPFVPDTVQKLLSIVLLNGANVMESAGLQIELREHSENLERLVAERTEDLRKSREEELNANRAKTMFLASMSHEIRTPLSSIIGFTNLLDRTVLDHKQREYADAVKTSSHALMCLINDVLDISKIEAGRMDIVEDDFDLRRILAECLNIVRVRAEQKGLRLILDCDARIVFKLRSDPARLRQILINLVGNAEKFTEKGSITLTARVAEETEDACSVRMSVADTGIGISPDARDNLFTTFTQVDLARSRRYGGTGLGLSISDKLVRLLGGDGIGVESEPGRGSTFSFMLPLAKTALPADVAGKEPVSAGRPKTEPSADTSQRRYRILVADDVSLNVKLAREILSGQGMETAGVENGREAVDILARERFDAVLMDMQMPVMDGLDATRRLRALGITVPVIAVTAGALEGDRRRCLKAGMNAYVTKPIDAAGVIKTIETACGAAPVPEANALNWNHSAEYPVDSAKALARIGGNRKLFKELLNDFAGQADSCLRELRHALDVGNAEGLRRGAHKIKGAAAALNAGPVQNLAARLEEMGKEEGLALAKELIENLDEEIEELKAMARIFEV